MDGWMDEIDGELKQPPFSSVYYHIDKLRKRRESAHAKRVAGSNTEKKTSPPMNMRRFSNDCVYSLTNFVLRLHCFISCQNLDMAFLVSILECLHRSLY